MAKKRSEVRRRRKSDATKKSVANVWLERGWRFATRPEFAGTLLLVAGLVLLIGPTTRLPESPSYGWWTAAFRFPDAVRVAASLIAASSVVILGKALAAEWSEGVISSRGRRRIRWARWIPFASLAAMVVGATGALFLWFGAQAKLPTSRVSIAPNQTIQSFPSIASGRTVKVMLPQKIRLVSLDAAAGKATVELKTAGEEAGVMNDVFIGDPLPVRTVDVALIGVEVDPRFFAARIEMKGGIEVLAAPGQKVRFTPDGEQFEIREVVKNYVGRLGPAVHIVRPDGRSAWVFERDSALEEPMTEFRLNGIQTAPVAVFSFASTRYGGGVAAFGLVFVLGLGLMLVRIEDEDESSAVAPGDESE